MDGGASLYAALAIGAASAAASGAAANSQNKANKASMRSAGRSRDAQLTQTAESAQLEKMKRLNQANAIRSRLAVTSIERGVGNSGSVAALDANEAYNAQLDQTLVDVNTRNANAFIASQAESQFASIMARNVSPLLAAFSGGMSGFTSGLAIGGAFDDYGPPTAGPTPTPSRRVVDGGNAGAPTGSAYA